MLSFNVFSRRNRWLYSACSLSAVLVCSAASCGSARAQAASGKGGNAGSTGQAQSGAGALGFSIESEMLTYRALESNSEAVACDIAAYLDGVPATFTSSSGGSTCSIKGEQVASQASSFSLSTQVWSMAFNCGVRIWRSCTSFDKELPRIAPQHHRYRWELEDHWTVWWALRR